MKAITREEYGNSEILKLTDEPRPEPEADELLIKVCCTTVNRSDFHILTGRPYIVRGFAGIYSPKHRIPGTDFAGEVVGVGSEVSTYTIGDRVWGFNDMGLRSHAEYMTISSSDAVTKIPDHISYATAAASAEGAHYAYNFINKLTIRPDMNVMVNGGTGAIGSAAIQLLRALGVSTDATAQAVYHELMRSIGARTVIDYTTDDFTAVLEPHSYDLIIDSVGKSTYGECKRLLKHNGIYMSSELGPRNENIFLPIWTKLRGGTRVIFPLPYDRRRSILHMTELLEGGRFSPLIDRTYSMTDIASAYDYVMSGQKIGNVIINF